MPAPKLSRRAKARVGWKYLFLRGVYWKNYAKAKYNEVLDRALGSGEYKAKRAIENKRENAKRHVEAQIDELRRDIEQAEAHLPKSELKKLRLKMAELKAAELAVSDSKTRREFWRTQWRQLLKRMRK